MTPSGYGGWRAAAGGLLVAALAGCGGGQAPSARPTDSGRTDLTITVTEAGRDGGRWTLRCDPAGGTHPDPEQACAALARNAGALQPVGRGQVCTDLFGGPEKATVTGTWAGKDVDTTLSRANGCEIKRWGDLTGLLPAAS